MSYMTLYTMHDLFHDFQRKNSHIITNDIVGDTLFYNNNMKFTTLDQDNDLDSTNCATHWRSGWWFNACSIDNPNGEYTDSEIIGYKYVTWKSWKNSYISVDDSSSSLTSRFIVILDKKPKQNYILTKIYLTTRTFHKMSS